MALAGPPHGDPSATQNNGRLTSDSPEDHVLNFAEVDTLITILSTPGYDPSTIQTAQQRLQDLQRSFEGWALAKYLFEHGAEIYQFWGANTFAIKIKRDWTSLDSVHNGHHELLGMLLSYFEQSVADAGTSRVSRKLYTALVSFFLQPDSRQPSWFRLVLLGNSYAAAIKSGDSDAFVRIFIRSMDPRRFKALLVLCTTMTEETIKTEPRHATTYNLAQRLTQNAEDIWRLLLSALTFVHPQSSLLSEVDYEEFGASARSPISDGQDLDRRAPAVAEQALGFLQIWITFSLDNVSKQQDDVRIMARKCVDLAAASVRLHELTARAIETLISVVESAPNLLHINDNPVLLGALTCEEAKGLVESLEQGEFETENIRFATFLVELADTQEFDTPDFLNNPILVQTLRHLQTLLKCKGVPGIDDEVCSMAMDIWTKVAGGLSDWVSHDQTSLEMKRLLVSCIDACVERMKFPDSADWDADDRSKVNQFERDLEDLLLATYSSLGFDLWLKAANQTLSSLASEQWQDFAASLFCLCALAEAVSDEESLNDHIKNVVGTPNWVRICQQGILPDEKARKWMTTFVASYSHYFQSHLEHLLPVMNFLFNSLLPSSSRSAASRAISTLCQVCRSTLTHNLYDLLQSIENIRWVSIEDEERLFRATAAVIQSLRPESAKYSPLRRLIDIPAREFHEVIHAGPEESEWAQNVSVNVLRKLAQIGKGLRAPEEEPIDLDVEPHDHANPRTEDFWFSGAGRDLKGDICKLIAGLAAKFPTNGQIIEGVCEVLKAGYTETRPSPFGFLPQITRDFFVAFCKPSTPSVSTVFATVSAFLASHAHKPQAIREDFLVIVKAIHENQFALLRRSVDPEIVDDHEFSYSSLDFLTKLLPSYGPIFFDITDTALGIPSNLPSNSTEFGRQQFWQVIFLFSLRQLGGSDTFPKRSAAQFWSAIFELSGPPTRLPPQIISVMAQLINHYAHEFTRVLLVQLTGECARSDIDSLCEPLRKYIGKYSMLAKKQLEGVISAPEVLPVKVQQSVAIEERLTFVKQILGLRGGKKTNSIVRDFWIRCRGSDFAYTT